MWYTSQIRGLWDYNGWISEGEQVINTYLRTSMLGISDYWTWYYDLYLQGNVGFAEGRVDRSQLMGVGQYWVIST